MSRIRLSLVLVLLLVPLGNGPWAQAPETSRPFPRILADWNRIFEQAESLRLSGALTPEMLEERQQVLTGVKDEAARARADAAKKIEALTKLREALGPPPGEGEPPEADEIAEKRASYDAEIADYRARIAQAELAIAKADELGAALAQRSRSELVTDLSRRFPPPWLPATVGKAIPELAAQVKHTLRIPVAWWQGLSQPARDQFNPPLIVLILFAAIALGTGMRVLLLRYFGRDPADVEPSYQRRFQAAVAEGVARGLIPALMLSAIMLRLQSASARVTGEFAELLWTLSFALIVVILAETLPRAVLAPRLPAWRLAPVGPRQGRAICRLISLLAIVFAVSLIMTTLYRADSSPALISLYTAVASALAGIAMILLVRGRLWQTESGEIEGVGPASDAVETAPPTLWSFWGGIRALIALVSLAGIVAGLTGYSRLSAFLIENLMVSGLTVGVLFILRGLLRELIGRITSSELLIDGLKLGHRTRQLIKGWTRAVLDLLAVLAGLALIVPHWGVSTGSMLRQGGELLRGFKIGNVTVSLVDIGLALGVFVLVLVITRVLQRGLAERLLPRTQLDIGVRTSLTAGLGYIGLALAAAIGVSVAGVDLSNIAIIAGALSVGIGFGLQNIVNNFVSGLILLVERPVKVGDWVVIGGNEGFVRRISVRATELETFQRASVIIPNAELLSGPVVNWTHKDRNGRIEIPVGVAYGSDVEKVREVLLECAKADERVLAHPAPFVVFRDFGDSSLNFELRCYTGDVLTRLFISSDIRFAIDRRFREEGIEIPFPQRVLHFAAGAPPEMPLPPAAPHQASAGETIDGAEGEDG